MVETQKRHVVVVGGGIVGTTIAEALLRDGVQVTLVEPGEFGGTQAASYGNGAFISPASIIPMSMPGLWAKVPGFLLDRTGPLTIRWAYMPRLFFWLSRFLMAGWTESRVTRTAAALANLLEHGPERHAALADRIGAPHLIQKNGLLYLYTSRADFEAEGLSLALRRKHGIAMREVEGAELDELAPGLAPRYRFGVLLTEGRHCASPGTYVAAIAAWCLSRGATHVKQPATDLRVEGGHVTAVVTTSGEIPCDDIVLTAGIGSGGLALRCGDRIPLEAERGYHIELQDCGVALPVPLMPQDLKVAIVSTTTGLRVAGQVEFASAAAIPDWRRAEILRDKIASCLPALAGQDIKITRWQGNRPSTSDGLPVIGAASGVRGVWYAFGHGHVGLNSAPMTAELIADLISARAPVIDPGPFRPSRFRKARASKNRATSSLSTPSGDPT